MNFQEYKSKTRNIPHPSFWESLKSGSPLIKTLLKKHRLPTRFKSKLIFRDIGICAWKPGNNLKFIEIDITFKCIFACPNCSRNCGQAPSDEHMTVGQIKKFVDESINLKWKWEKITIEGGEPTLNPNFWKIIEEIKRYKRYNPKCIFCISSTGTGKKIRGMINKLPLWFCPSAGAAIPEGKKSAINDFMAYNVAPIDLEEYKNYKDKDYSKGCWITHWCGMGLNKYGYYASGPGAALDRVFGFDIGIKKLSEVNLTSIKNQMKKLCRYCGFFKGRLETKFREQITSPSWEKALQNYRNKKPKLTLY